MNTRQRTRRILDGIEEHEDTLSCLTRLLAPGVEGLELAKQAIILTLASPDDHGSDRGRLHTLLYGPPGTGKSTPLRFVSDALDVPVFSPRGTKAGLTADLRSGRPGALPQMHDTPYRVFILDELDKAPKKNREHLLQALEDGEFTVSSATVTETYDAEVRMLATANRTEGFASELVDRFDFAVYVPRPDQQAAQQIMDTVTSGFMQGGDREATYGDVLRLYLDRIKRYDPVFPDSERARVADVIGASIEDDEVCIRSKVAVLRVAYTLARIERSPVEAHHAEQAIDLLDRVDRRQPR